MSETRERTCSNCLYWDRRSDSHGLCRGRPPSRIFPGSNPPADDRQASMKMWPTTSKTDWCKEHDLR